ncbi:hypothetical protein, partial [Cysteiniphilum litorale]|uniref:hypothetical protein n=1 Tax=Cysteiniphilum litorale TaxID=2056700 RepID=UPI003F881DB0
MEIWLDSSDLNDATYFDAIGLINGITTNPKILANNQGSPLTTLQKLLAVNEQPICVQVTATHTDAIIVCIRMIVNGHSHYREQIFSRRGDIL